MSNNKSAYSEGMLRDPFALKYHLMPAGGGWMNDPNGLCQYRGVYHIFYQYAAEPDGSSGKCWGHYTTRDFVQYKDEGIALYPDTASDKDGVYSGCAYIEKGMHLFYTGNVKLPGEHDYTHSGRLSNTNYVYSEDGVHFSCKQTLLTNEDYPADLTCHIRDPKVYKKDGHYVMYLGARDKQDRGSVLLYESEDLLHWQYRDRISSRESFGYMWECPDCFELGGETFLLTCPQGIKQKGYQYENSNQNGYFKVADSAAEDYETLDYGYDFYAPQTFADETGRRILIGWMGIPDNPYENPTVANGWQMALTLPREIQNVQGKIYQYPIAEILALKQESHVVVITSAVTVLKKTCFLRLTEPEQGKFSFRVNQLSFIYDGSLFTLQYHNESYGRTARHIEIAHLEKMDMFFDASCVEIFINGGEKTMTCRFYDEEPLLQVSASEVLFMEYAAMNSFAVVR